MKHLPKHLQPRWRYLAVGIETWPAAILDRGGFQRELWYAAQNLLGDPGSAAADLTVVRFSFEDATGEAVIRARHGHVGPARAALACIDRVDGHEIGLRVRGVSGTIRGCEEKYLGRPPEPTEERNVVIENAEHTAIVRSPRMDVRTDSVHLGATELDFE